MYNTYITRVEDLQDILNNIENAISETKNIKTSSVMNWDQVSLIHKIQEKSTELYKITKSI